MVDVHSENALAVPDEALRGVATRYNGFSYRGPAGGVHRGLPSRHLTLVISFGPPLVVERSGGDGQADIEGTGTYSGLVAGLRSTFVPLRRDDRGSGVIVSLSPLGVRRLFGVPPQQVSGRILGLDQLLGGRAAVLSERIAAAPTWSARFAVLDDVLRGMLTDQPEPPAALAHAWRRLVADGGRMRVDALAAEVGWSRRHLENRFRGEFGLGVKEAARVLRFERAVAGLSRGYTGSLADLAVACGYYDQSHLANEWRSLAGQSVTDWLADEPADPPPDLTAA